MSNIDSGNVTRLIYIDLRKAFDTVNHCILIQKLAAYGVAVDNWNWYCSYLDSRSQYIQWQGETSGQKSIPVGVPQGSIIGPLLFTLYVNDFPDYVDNAVDMYADDSTSQAHAKDINTVENKLTEMLAKAAECMKNNTLTLHRGKTKAQLIGSNHCVTKNTKITVKFNDQIIELVHSAKLLGIHIDSNLTWEEHYNYICKKISENLGVLKYIRDYIKFDILKMVHNSTVLPHMDYIPIVCGRCPNMVNNDRMSKL